MYLLITAGSSNGFMTVFFIAYNDVWLQSVDRVVVTSVLITNLHVKVK